MSDLRPDLAALVASVQHPSGDPATLRDDTVLLDGGLALDSLAVLEIVLGLEERFGLPVPAEDVTPAHLGTFGRLIAYVERRRAAAAP